MGTRPTIRTITTYKATEADNDNARTIADALRREGLEAFPTRSSVLRWALAAVATHVREMGHLPTPADQA